MTAERFSYLFTKQLEGNCSELESQELAEPLKSGIYDAIAAELLDQYWAEAAEKEIDQTRSQVILDHIFASGQEVPQRRTHMDHRIWIGIAAAAVLLIISSMFFFKGPSGSAGMPEKHIAAIGKATTLRKYSTANEHRKVTLPDGSTVILNNNSTLSLAADFNHNRREVHIVGEGYFDIVHDISKPFIVTSGEVKTTVLGTAFNVRAYHNSKVEVTVTRGKVSVLSGQKVVGILTPNRRITIPHTLSHPVISKVIAKNAIRWQENDLFFDNISLAEASAILAQKFNTPITIADERAKACRFTATFLQGESLDEVLKVICSFNNAQYHKNAAGITINGSGC